MNLGPNFEQKLAQLSEDESRKHLEKIADARKNHELKKEKLEVALRAHEGLLSSLVSFKGDQFIHDSKMPIPEVSFGPRYQ